VNGVSDTVADVLVVLTNWKRPANVRLIVQAFLAQTVPVDIVVVDNSPKDGESEFNEPELAARLLDVWRFRDNAGPPCRFAPSFMRHSHRYILFHDDDLLPGPRAVEHLMEAAKRAGERFATIGQTGRRFEGGPNSYRHPMPGYQWLYVPRNVKRSENLTPVDMTCRSHFVRADQMQHVLTFKWELLRTLGSEKVRPAIDVHDDLLLCLGIQKVKGWPSYLTHVGPPETCLRRQNLPAPYAVSERQPHHAERTDLIQWAELLGWRSVWQAAEKELAA
jgi:glycosyltransferase involved in cell wall biosynthesis